jgi:hypothetical protein
MTHNASATAALKSSIPSSLILMIVTELIDTLTLFRHVHCLEISRRVHASRDVHYHHSRWARDKIANFASRCGRAEGFEVAQVEGGANLAARVPVLEGKGERSRQTTRNVCDSQQRESQTAKRIAECVVAYIFLRSADMHSFAGASFYANRFGLTIACSRAVALTYSA